MLEAFQTDVPGVEVSRGIGMCVGLLIPVTVALHGFRRMTASDNNPKCGLALGLAGSGWAISGVGYAATVFNPDLRPLLMLTSVVMLLLIVLAVVMAILGLIEMAGTTRVVRGKGQAVGTFVLGGIMGIAFIAGLFMGLSASKVPDDWRLPPPIPGSKLFFPSKNFSLTVPGGEWVRLNPGKLNPLADAAFVRERDGIFFIVIATNLPAGASATQEKLVEVSRGELLGADPSGTAGPPTPEAIGTIQGTSFTVEAKTKGTPLSYRYWVYSAGPRVYQLVTWGPRSAASKLPEAAGSLMKGFELIGP